MAINTEYYGDSSSWQTAHAKSANSEFTVKIAAFNPAHTTECLSGALVYKYGDLYDATESYQVEVDPSFCYCAMDADAPMLTALFATAPITSGDNAGHYYASLKTAPDKPVPFGWSMGTVQQYVTVLGNGSEWANAPVNYQPTWYSSSWHPSKVTSSGKTAVCYLANSAPVDYTLAPVLSMQYRCVKLVPVIRAYSLASGKTTADVRAAVTLSDFNACISGSVVVDLKTYLTDSYDGDPFYSRYPVISSVYAMPVLMYFDGDGDLTPPPGSNDVYHSTAESTAGWLSLRSALNPVYMHAKTEFTEIYQYDGSAYADSTGAACECMMLPATRAPFSYVYYAYNGGTSPTKSLSVDSNGWGAFCILGRAAASGNLRTDMYCRVIDCDHWRTFWDSSNSNCECGNVIADFVDLAGFREYVRKAVAYFGMFFSDGVEGDVPETADMDTAGLHLGIIDSSGITHGAYTTGTQNQTAPNYGWTDPVDDTPWTPGGGGDDDGELPSDPNVYNSAAASGFGIALKYYALRRTDLDDLYAWVYQYMDYSLAVVAATAAGDPYESEFNRLYPDAAAWHAYVCDRAGHGVYPTDNIVGIMAYPFDLTGSAAGYRMGAWDTSQVYNHFDLVPGAQTLTGLAVTGDGYKIVSLGSGAVEFAGLHGDYRDTAPYTRIDLQIPYHGTVALEPGAWIGHTLTVEAVVDLMCGSSVAVILRDGAPMMTVPGQMGISVPITRDNVSQTANTFMAQSNAYQSSVLGAVSGFAQGVLRYVGGAAGAVSAGLTGDLPGVVTGALGTIAGGWGTLTAARQEQIQIRQQQYDMQHIVTGRMVSGGGSPACNAKLGTRCRLVWHYPRELPGSNAADYPAIAGHACSCTDVIGAFTGFAQFGAVDLSGLTCTDTEKAVILQALQAGVYI